MDERLMELDAWIDRALKLYHLADFDMDDVRAAKLAAVAGKTSARVAAMLDELAGGEDGQVDVGGGA